MKKHFALLFIFTLIFTLGHSQGILRGKITDENGESVIGGLISFKDNKLVATSTDLDGNYSLKVSDSTKHVLVVSLLGYQTIEKEILLKSGIVQIINFDLKPIAKEIKELVVEAKVNKARDFYMEKMKINSSTTIDYISSETIKKTGDANVTAAVSRVSGVSTNGSFITVRGIGDRYVKTSINGLVIPTLDPLTNNIKLDLFPANLLDNLFISKTASPDLPGDFSGAFISLETKDYPDKLNINIETTFGYNPQSSFKDVLSSQRSSTDWLGYDNGFRNIDHSKFLQVNLEPSPYQEFSALGLGDYFNSLGINNTTTWNESYTKLALVELGYLDKGKFYDQASINEAKIKYSENNVNQNKAFKSLNADAVHSSQELPNNWNTLIRKGPLNTSQSFSIGNQFLLFNRPFGIITGFRYSSTVQYDSISDINRANVDVDGNRGLNFAAKQKTTKETNGWSGLAKVSYKLHPNHSISLLFMPNFTGVNNVRSSIDSANGNVVLTSKDQFYEQRKQLVYQAKTEHFISRIKSKIESNFSYTIGKSIAPDFKNLQYGGTPGGTNYQIGGLFAIRRFYRYLNDNLFDSKIKMEIPFFEKAHLTRKLRFGASYLNSKKENRQYEYFLNFGPNALQSFDGNVDKFLALDEFGFSNYNNNGLEITTINKYYRRLDLPAYHTIGESKITSVFLMTDFVVVPKFRFSGGVRMEKTNIYTDVFLFDSLGLKANDQRRLQKEDVFMVNPGKINQTNFLPSVNFIYKIKSNEESPINFRANYSKTIARPSVRELTETQIYDYEFRTFVFGNSSLKTVDIHNFDIRVESYLKNSDNISVSFFYKNFINHIELVQTQQGYTWQNVDNSFVKGIELDGKKKLSKYFEFRANVTFANSYTSLVQNALFIKEGIKYFSPVDTIKRQMYGQAPYVLNGILSYNNDSLGLVIAIGYNVQGPRLVLISVDKTPNIYELPRHLLDFRISKSIGKHFFVGLNIKDILNSPIRRAYKYPEGYTLNYDKFRFGTNYNLSFSYKF